MIAAIRAFFARRRAADDERDYTRGYDYAAGALLRGTSPRELELESDALQYTNHFDRGIVNAIRDWKAATC